MDIRLHAFSGLTGAHITRLTYTSLSWSDSINEEGSINATVVEDSLNIGSIIKPYGTIIAAISGNRIIHAGYVTHVARSNENNQGMWDIDAGGGLTILDKRLVMNYALNSSWVNGNVVVDEENPKGDWLFSIKGTYSDLVSRLISETKKWGALPITPASIQGGSSHERNYNSYDLATVLDRIKDIGDLEDGVEIRLDPVLDSKWNISFVQKTATEIIDNRWKWNAMLPDSGVDLMDQDSDGEYMCSQSYAIGGRDEDKLLVCRATSNRLTNQGWPVLQIANTQHSSVSDLSTLLSYAKADVSSGDTPQMCYGLRVSLDKEVHVGDWVDLRCRYGLLTLKVVDVRGKAGQSYQDIECRERE